MLLKAILKKLKDFSTLESRSRSNADSHGCSIKQYDKTDQVKAPLPKILSGLQCHSPAIFRSSEFGHYAALDKISTDIFTQHKIAFEHANIIQHKQYI